MKKRTFIALVKDKVISAQIQKYIAEYIALFDDKQIRISIEEKPKQRTIKQNRFYFGVIVPAVKEWLFEQGINMSSEETHDWIVKRVWKFTEYVDMPDGEQYERRKSSTVADTKLWEQYQDLTRAWFAERGLPLPFPNEKLPDYLLAG